MLLLTQVRFDQHMTSHCRPGRSTPPLALLTFRVIGQMPMLTVTLAVCVLETRTDDVQQIIMSFLYNSELQKEKSAVGVLTDVDFDTRWENHEVEVKVTQCNDHSSENHTVQWSFEVCITAIWSNEFWVRAETEWEYHLLSCVPASCGALWECYMWGASLCWNKPPSSPAHGGCRSDDRWRASVCVCVFISVCIYTLNPTLIEVHTHLNVSHFWVNDADISSLNL